MPESDAGYLFQPLDRRGVLLGLQPIQLLTLGAGFLVAAAVHALLPPAFGLAGAAMVFAGSMAVGLWWRHGAPLCSWAATGVGFAWRRPWRPVLTDAPLAGSGRRTLADRTAPPGMQVSEERDVVSGSALGVIRDSRAGALVGVIPVHGCSFTLMDAAEQAQHLEGWRRVLGSVARPGTPIVRLQWIERSRPLLPAGLPRPPDGSDRSVCRALVDEAEPEIQQFESWLALAVGGGKRAVSTESLLREMRLMSGQLRQAGLHAGDALSLSELLALFDPDGQPSGRASPSAIGDQWGAVRIDSWWHATYWIADWPRVSVGPAFLAPLLLGSGRRTVSVVMAPVPSDQALRQARSARTADVADEQLRARAGFLPSARREKESEGTARREVELADGHCEFRFSGYVTVTAPDLESLRTTCSDTEHLAQAAHVELRRLFGRQAEARTWTLPLGRGLR